MPQVLPSAAGAPALTVSAGAQPAWSREGVLPSLLLTIWAPELCPVLLQGPQEFVSYLVGQNSQVVGSVQLPCPGSWEAGAGNSTTIPTGSLNTGLPGQPGRPQAREHFNPTEVILASS